MTDFQPTFPAEVPFSDAEIAFSDESPPGLFPDNQNSNFGFVIRKIFSDHTQELINQLNTIYSEKFISTSLQYLDEWERVVDLPVAPTNYTVPQRRSLILNRLRKSPFTHASRRLIVESFITATFGDAVQFTVDGIPFDSAGIPLYSGIFSLAGTYAIREPHPWRQLVDNPGFEVDAVGTTASGGTVARSTAQAMFGVGSALLTATGTAAASLATVLRSGSRIPVTANQAHVISSYVRPGTGLRTVQLGIDWYTSGGTLISSSRGTAQAQTAGKWTRFSYSAVAPGTAATAIVYPVILGTGAINDTVYVDGIMFELGTAPTDYSLQTDSPFWYEVRILNTLGVDVIGLTRELTRITPAGITFTVNQVAQP